MKTKEIIISCIKYLFVLLFVYAAASKLLDFNTFQNQLGQSPLLSAYAHIISWAVPISEIGIAILLVTKKYHVLGLYGFYMMMVMFTTYIIIILNFTSFTPCSCGGVLEKLGWTEHLIFNLFFIILSVALIYYYSQKYIENKRIFKYIILLTILGVGFIIILFLSSDNQTKRNNAFIRKYIPHPIEKVAEYQLESNSFYLAGIDYDKVYLGNYYSPLLIKSIDYTTNQIFDNKVSIDSFNLPFQRVRTYVNPPIFFLGDGTVPVLFKGNLNNFKASLFSINKGYFTEYFIRDTTSVGFTTISSYNKRLALGIQKRTSSDFIFKLNDTTLIHSSNTNTFHADGLFLWNNKHQKFIYTYFYRNSYEVLDSNLLSLYKGKTIDTISTPILDIAYYKKTNTYKLGPKSIKVNRQSATYGNLLFIHSDRLGKYEKDKILTFAKIIDVYDFNKNNYLFSFYLYHQPNQSLSEFKVYKDLLVAIVDNKLLVFRLKPTYFTSELLN